MISGTPKAGRCLHPTATKPRANRENAENRVVAPAACDMLPYAARVWEPRGIRKLGLEAKMNGNSGILGSRNRVAAILVAMVGVALLPGAFRPTPALSLPTVASS
jgi:hypothetical protein